MSEQRSENQGWERFFPWVSVGYMGTLTTTVGALSAEKLGMVQLNEGQVDLLYLAFLLHLFALGWAVGMKKK